MQLQIYIIFEELWHKMSMLWSCSGEDVKWPIDVEKTLNKNKASFCGNKMCNNMYIVFKN